MIGPIDDELDDSEQRQARIARPTSSPFPALTLRGLNLPTASTSPSATPAASPNNASPENEMQQGAQASRGLMSTGIAKANATKPSALDSRKLGDETEVNRLQGSPSGIGKIQKNHPILGGVLRGLETVGDVLSPAVTAMIPGTELHHNQLLRQARGRLGEDVAQGEKEATTAKTQADTEEAEARTGPTNEQAKVAGNPKQGLTPEETTIHDLMTGQSGAPRINPKTNQPYTYLEAYEAVQQAKQDTKPEAKKNDFEQFYADWLKDNNFPDTAHNRLMARQKFAAAGQAPQRDPRQLAVSPDGTVVELRPGSKVPQGTRTLSSEMKGPSADEQRRADLAQNMNENLDQLEDILKRRPELFGPIAGRVTGIRETVGTGDPDVAALKTIEEQMGMAMVGAHAMRNAQHVATAAQAITNSFHNKPDAITNAIQTARKSLATFQENAGQQAGSSGTKTGGTPKDFGPAPAGKADGSTGTLADGTKVKVKGGRLVAQ